MKDALDRIVELAEALEVLDREFADQAIAEAEYLEKEGNHAMQDCANRSANLWLNARVALAKYKEIAELEAALAKRVWNPDMDAAPRDGTDILCYFPLEGLGDDWCRVVPVYFSAREDRWNFASRAASGFSKEYNPTDWMPLPTPTEDKS